MRRLPFFVLVLALAIPGALMSAITSIEPGAISLEDILPKPLHAVVAAESIIYYQSNLQRALGGMGAGTVVQVVAMKNNTYRVRGHAHHGDVAGWMRVQDLKFADPQMPQKLKAFADRNKIVADIVQKHQVAIGMTADEVKASLGMPTRKSAKITADGREEVLEYVTYKTVPQTVPGRDRFGNPAPATIFVKVESGRLSLTFKGGAVTEIEESQGNPLGGDAGKTVPAPVIVN